MAFKSDLSRRLSWCAFGTFLSGFPLTLVALMLKWNEPEYVFLGCVALTILFVLSSLIVTLFFVTQIRLSELVVLITFLGCTVGMLARSILPQVHNEDVFPRIILFALAIGGATIVVVGGATWGFWIASVLNRNTTLQRIWLMTVGVFALVAAPAWFVGLFILPASNNDASGLAVLAVSTFLLGYVVALYIDVRDRRAVTRQLSEGLMIDPVLVSKTDNRS